jgi:hypothetical protein
MRHEWLVSSLDISMHIFVGFDMFVEVLGQFLQQLVVLADDGQAASLLNLHSNY